MIPLIQSMRQLFHQQLLSAILTLDENGVPSNADKHQKTSIEIAKSIYRQIGGLSADTIKMSGQSSGALFEGLCEAFLSNTFLALNHLRPGNWAIEKVSSRKGITIAQYEQYSHLIDLEQLARQNLALAAAIGNDYTITPDIVILRYPELDESINAPQLIVDSTHSALSPIRRKNNVLPLLHASISCKWTLRSDRAQNARSEALNLIRNRKGRTPHIILITAEPSPSRIASIALGTGDIDCVYHFALNELVQSVREMDNDESDYLLTTMIEGKRLKDISDLPLDLSV